MKRIFSLIITLCLILSVFSGCSNGYIFNEKNESGTLPVKEMTVGIFHNVSFTGVGEADAKGFRLGARCMNGQATDKGSYYYYKPVENFTEVTKNAKGIVIYKGIAYAVTEENGKEYLTVISDHAAHYLRKYEANEFKNAAVNFYRSYGNTTSGGDGLLPSDKYTSS